MIYNRKKLQYNIVILILILFCILFQDNNSFAKKNIAKSKLGKFEVIENFKSDVRFDLRKNNSVLIKNSEINRLVLQNYSIIENSNIFNLQSFAKTQISNSSINDIDTRNELIVSNNSNIYKLISTGNVKMSDSKAYLVQTNGFLFLDNAQIEHVKLMTNGCYLWNSSIDILELNDYSEGAKQISVQILGASSINSLKINSNKKNNKVLIILDRESSLRFKKDSVDNIEQIDLIIN